MSNTKLLKEAIADAKTVRETAIANAKIALEEAFTPKLQSMLSKKLQEEMEDEDETTDDDDAVANESFVTEEEDVDSDSDEMEDEDETTDESFVTEDEDEDEDVEDLDLDEILREMGYDDDVTEEEDEFDIDDVTEEEDEFDIDDVTEEEDDFDIDLEEIIRELEDEYEDDLEEGEVDGVGYHDPTNADDADLSDLTEEEDEDDDEELDLDEILREMGHDLEDDVTEEEDEDMVQHYEEALSEAYSTIKSLKATINEVNLLNAKLLYSNKLFRGYELTNEQKRKVIDTIDRTQNIREIKLVFSALAESFQMAGTTPNPRRRKQNVLESLASKPTNSTAPKKIIKESNELAERFKKLANIKK